MLSLYEEAARCLLCKNPECTKSCSHGFNPARMIQSVRFENECGAANFVDSSVCKKCTGECEKACIHYDMPIRIREMAKQLPQRKSVDDISLETEFLGLKCENPFFLSSSIVASSYEMCARALEMGWGGIVYKTIGFFKPNEVSPRFDALSKEGKPFIGFKNLEQISDRDLRLNLDILRRLKQNFPSKIIVASIMGENDDEWRELARLCCEAGVDIIECNFSCPQMTEKGLGSDVGINPELVAQYTAAAKSGSSVPVIAKMTPNITNMELPAIAAVNAGADGLAAINTIKCITGLDLENGLPKMSVNRKNAVSGYSGKAVKPIALRFIYDMASCGELKGTQISGMGGIETWRDAMEFIQLGCSNIQITTAVMQYGYRIIYDLLDGTKQFMSDHNIHSINELVGSQISNFVNPDLLDRDTVIYPVIDKSRCVGCGRCEISCNDAGHSAITAQGKAKVNGEKCVGCHLCALVCPMGAISASKRVKKRC